MKETQHHYLGFDHESGWFKKNSLKKTCCIKQGMKLKLSQNLM
jgi:hypothetical protein